MTNLWVAAEDLGTYSNSSYAYDACKSASHILWTLSGRKFSGITTVTEKYVSQFDPYFRTAGSGYKYLPTLIAGNVQNLPIGRDLQMYGSDFLGDGTSSRTRVRLRGRKVIKIHTVRDKSGNIIDSSKYYLADHSTVYASEGSSWNPFNVEITYTYGSPPPTSGRAAAKLLATEIVKMYEGDDTCALPQRVTSVSRQGVNYTILDTQDFLQDMRTGIYAVDLFLKSVNPDKARARARVFNPDGNRARRVSSRDFTITPSSFDLYVRPEGGAVVIYLSEINAQFLTNDASWVLSAMISDWSNSKSQIIQNSVVLDSTLQTLRISCSYQTALSILGSRDPGVLDVYATRPSIGNPSVNEVINILSSNISLQLGDKIISIRTA